MKASAGTAPGGGGGEFGKLCWTVTEPSVSSASLSAFCSVEEMHVAEKGKQRCLGIGQMERKDPYLTWLW